MKKFKVSYTGFVYVEAENVEDAEERFDNDDCLYGELRIDSIEEVSKFAVDI